jgi:hypothetical protein
MVGSDETVTEACPLGIMRILLVYRYVSSMGMSIINSLKGGNVNSLIGAWDRSPSRRDPSLGYLDSNRAFMHACMSSTLLDSKADQEASRSTG